MPRSVVPWYDSVDLDSWIRSRLEVKNLDGGRGYDVGVRIVDCPFCGDTKGHGWFNVQKRRGDCFRVDCPISGGVGALDYVGAVEGFAHSGETLLFLRREFPRLAPDPPPKLRLSQYVDWCRLPPITPITRTHEWAQSLLFREAVKFAWIQWGIRSWDLERVRAGYCVQGRYCFRIVFPIYMNGKLVGFESRSYRNGEPRYLTSKFGEEKDPTADCGRPKEALLYNYDEVSPGEEILLVEGPGDVVRVRHILSSGMEAGTGVPVGLLGSFLTEEKLALILAKAPKKIIVALDQDAEDKSEQIARQFAKCGIPTEVGRWIGGKDAGSGARLEISPRLSSAGRLRSLALR